LETFGSSIVVDGVEKKFLGASWNLLRKSFLGKNKKKNYEREKSGPEIFCGHFLI